MQYLFDAITCDALRGDEMRKALDASKLERSRQRDKVEKMTSLKRGRTVMAFVVNR